MRRLKDFRRPRDFMFICLRIINSCLLDHDSHHDAREAFLTINQSDSGQITQEELMAALPDLTEEEAFSIISNACQETIPETEAGSSINSVRETIKWSEF